MAVPLVGWLAGWMVDPKVARKAAQKAEKMVGPKEHQWVEMRVVG